MSIGNDKPQTTPNETVSKDLSVQQPTKLIGYDKHGESMYNRLQRLCHPKNFVDNYDKDKVDAANVIYSKLLDTNRDDINAVVGLVVMAEKELNTNLLDEYQFDRLKNILNPKNYMEPYDASSVALSNELYSQLMQPDLNYTKYVQIISKSEPLLQIAEKVKQEEQGRIEKERIEEQEELRKGFILSIIMIILIVITVVGFVYLYFQKR